MLVRHGKLKYILRPGTKVLIDRSAAFSAAKEPDWHEAIVIDTLSSQFTSELDNGLVVYRMYRDVTVTWKPTGKSL